MRTEPAANAMTDYASTCDLPAAAELIRQSPGPVIILTHAKPDGDAFGSVVALAAAIKALGQTPFACFVPPVPASLMDLRGSELVHVYDHDQKLTLPDDAGLYALLDTGAYSQLADLRPVIEANLDRTLILDHHLSGDVAAAHRYIDGRAAAACEIVAQLLDHLLPQPAHGSGQPVDPATARTIAEALFVGIASDTGWFRFSNTRPETHELAARLLRQGVDHAALYQALEQTERPEKLALLIRALDSLKLIADGQAAIMTLRVSDFAETGALEEETERLIDVPQQVGTIRVIVLVAEKRGSGPGQPRVLTRISFRSKPGDDAVNVAELARQFDGGGHARAAGARVAAPVADVLPRLEAALTDALRP